MKLRALVIGTFGLVCLVGAVTVDAQQRRMRHTLPEPEIRVDSEDGSFTMPFELVNNHLLIPVSAGGRSFRTILDTGMPMSGLMLYDSPAVEGLELDYAPMRIAVAGAGGDGEPIAARMAFGQTLEVGAATLEGAPVLVMPRLPKLSLYHEGVIGAALFNRFAVEIDYDERVVRFHEPGAFRPAEGAVAVPISLDSPPSMPFAEVTVTLPGGQPTKQTVVIDLGASHAISLNVDTSEALHVPTDAIETVIGHGVGGKIDGHVARLATLELGGFELNKPIATFPVEQHQHPGAMDSRNGNLGSDVLKRFDVTFDYANERMWLVPNRGFEAPFEWDMSGMRLTPDDDGLRIEQVVAGSPAAEAGLRAGDLVLEVDGRTASAENLIELRDNLRHDGKRVSLRADRAGETIDVKLKLRRLV